jgi:hypothetical protein
MPFLGFLLGMVVFLLFYEHMRWDVVDCAIGVWCGSSGLGIASALGARARVEKLWGLTALGFLLNLVVILLGILYFWNRSR